MLSVQYKLYGTDLAVHYGLPESIISDQVWNFERVTLFHSCASWQKYRYYVLAHTTHKKNGQCEWFNHTLINMLGYLAPHKKSSWRDIVPKLVHVYNCTRSTATGLAHTIWCIVKSFQLPIDLYFGTQNADLNTAMSSKYVQQLHERLKWAYKTAQHVTERKTTDIRETMVTKSDAPN